MRGKVLIVGAAVALAAFAGILWYAQFYAFYRETPEPEGGFFGEMYAIEDWQAIDATSSPLKLRVCATVTEATAARIADDMVALAPGEPLVAPDWFECFDARRLSQDLGAGRASFYNLRTSDFDGVDTVMALYPDGRLYIWRQLDERFRE